MSPPETLGRIGFVGCGTITAAIVEGLDAAGLRAPLVVSPRSAKVAAGLAARFAQISVAATNQDVLDRCDIVVLAVRPQVVDEVLAGLTFRPDHRVISLVAAVSLAFLEASTAPARSVARAVPLPFVARRQGVTAIYPSDHDAQALFDAVGRTVVANDEDAFHTLTAATAIMSSHYAAADAVAAWMAGQGTDAADARRFVAGMLEGLAGTAAASADSFAALADEHETAGGINAQVRTLLAERGAFAAYAEALDGVRERLRKAAR